MTTNSTKQLYFVEMTDTYGGEANYCWVNRFVVKASSMRGAMTVVSKETGYRTKQTGNYGDFARYDAKGANVCFFVDYADEYNMQQSHKVLN